MSDRHDARIRAFVVELLNDPPEAPPFPRPDMVVVEADRSDRRELVTDTETRNQETRHPRWWRGPIVAAGAFGVVVAVAVVALVATALLDAPEAGTSSEEVAAADGEATELDVPELVINSEDGAATLRGTTGTVVDGIAISRPDAIEFGSDGTYRVIDGGNAVDTGVYTTDGDSISFESAPTDEVLWVRNDAVLRVAHTCEGFVGEYRLIFQGGHQVGLEAVWDECPTRTAIANGLELEVVASL